MARTLLISVSAGMIIGAPVAVLSVLQDWSLLAFYAGAYSTLFVTLAVAAWLERGSEPGGHRQDRSRAGSARLS